MRFSRSLLRLQHTYNNTIDQLQARGLYLVALITLALGLVEVGVNMVVGADPNMRPALILNVPVSGSPILPALTATGGSILVIILLNRGNLAEARLLFVGMTYVFALLFNLLSGSNDLRTGAVVAFSVPVVAAGVLLRRQGLVTVILLVILAIIGLGIILSLGLIIYPPQQFGPMVYAVRTIFFLILCGLLLYIFSSGQRSLLQSNVNLAGELAGLTALTSLLSGGNTLEQMLNRAAEMIRDQFGYYLVQIFLLEERTGVLTLAADTTTNRLERDTTLRRIPPDSPSVVNEAARIGKALRITSDAPLNRRAEFAPATRTELVIPFAYNGRVIGVLDIQSTMADAFNESDISALGALSTQLGLATYTLRLEDALNHATRDQQELIEQVRTASRDIERLNQEMTGRAWQAYMQSRTDKLVSYEWVDGVVLPSKTPLSMPQRGPYGWSPRIETRDGDQVLIVPIVSRGQALGVMEFRAPPGQLWDDRSVELARAIAQRLALSLDNLRLYEQAQMAVAREQVANRVATVLQSKTEIDALVAVAVDTFQQALGALSTNIRLGLLEQPAPNLTKSNGANSQKKGTS